MSLAYDPFQTIFPGPPPVAPGHTLSTRTLEIPEEDHGLFDQLRSDPKMTNIRDEIALNKYLRIQLQREFEQQSQEERSKLAQKLVEQVRTIYGEDSSKEEQLYRHLEKVLPAAKMSIPLAKTISKLLETSGKLAEQQQKILEGTVITVRGDSRERMQRIFTDVIRPCCPPDVWAAIMQRAEQFIPRTGVIESLDLT